ncbi:hypothetical protein C4J81_10360 [Deltaproteobacteria bacterium Smac51]|nr:hypothetical protein C4J81_10360 [Deltaproteobacteria bacterium Smac51]
MPDRNILEKEFELGKLADEIDAENCTDSFFSNDSPHCYEEKKRSFFSFRNHWLAWVIGLNLLSMSAIFFIASKGHPLEYVSRVANNLFYSKHAKSEEDRNRLIEQDYQNINKVIRRFKGENARYQIYAYDIDSFYKMMARYPSLSHSPGNHFIELDTGYYYLSSDRQRLYRCHLEEKRSEVVRSKIKEEVTVYNPQEINGVPQQQPKEQKSNEIYQAPDGTWKNY